MDVAKYQKSRKNIYTVKILMQIISNISANEIPADEFPHFADLDFVEAVEFHTNFRKELLRQIEENQCANSEKSAIDQIEECSLGTWLSGEGKEVYWHLYSFQNLVIAHEEFHRHVDMIQVRIWAGAFGEAEELLRNEFSQATRRIVIALNELHSECK